MFAITRAERNRRRYVRTVRTLVGRMFSHLLDSSDPLDQSWNNWLNVQEREERDLRDLLATEVKDVFKARALAILMAPRIRLAPFAWRENSASLNDYLFMLDKINLEALTPQLREFVLALLEINIGVALAPDADENLRRTLSSYNSLILQALALLGENDPRAARLFELYQLNDPLPYFGIDEASGYQPFSNLLYAKVPEKWKRLADENLRGIIRAEQEGRSEPRCGWERALGRYLGYLQSELYGDVLPYSQQLYASQVSFVFEVPNTAGKELFGSWQVGLLLQRVPGEPYRELRHRIARRIVLEDRGEHKSFDVYSPETLEAARLMLAEFGEIDIELRERLGALIAADDSAVRERQSRDNEHRERVNAAVAAMR